MRLRSILLALAATAATRTLAAQVTTVPPTQPPAQAPSGPEHPIQFVVTGGLTVPAADLKDFNDPGFHVAGSMLFKFAGFPLTLRPEASLTRLKQKIATVGNPQGSNPYRVAQTETYETTQMLGALGNLELPIFAGVYVLAGVGALNIDTQVESQTKATFNAGAGWRFHLGRLGGFLEARVGTASYEAGKLGFSSAQYIPVSLGLVF